MDNLAHEFKEIKSWVVVFAEEDRVEESVTVRVRLQSGNGAVLLARDVSQKKRVVIHLDK